MTNQPTEEPCSRGDSRSVSDDWQERYEAGATGWDRGEPSPALMQWLENGDLEPCRILVPGCGRGYEVIELASRGFDVTAIDFAKAPIQELTRKLSESGLVAEVLQEDVLQFTSIDKYEAIYEQTCLCAIDPKHWHAYEQRLASSICDGGKLFALFMQSGKTDRPPFTCNLAEMQSLFGKSHWTWPDNHFVVDHPAGMKEIAVALQRKGKA